MISPKKIILQVVNDKVLPNVLPCMLTYAINYAVLENIRFSM